MLKIDGFKLWLSQNGRGNSTIYRHEIALRILERKGVEFTKEGVDSFLFKLKQEGRRNSYLNTIINTVVLYAQFAQIEELKSHKRFKKEPFVKATMSDEEIEAFLTLPPRTRGAKTKRNHDVYTLRKHPLIRKASDPRSLLLALLDAVTRLFEKDERFEKTVDDHGEEVVIRVRIKKGK